MAHSLAPGQKKTGNFRELRKSNRLFTTQFPSEDHAALLAKMR